MVNLYDVFEFRVTNSKAYSNPFDYTVIELQATFHSPSGRSINFFGFYDGNGNMGQTGNIWKLRFMPDEVGNWSYTYTWTDGTPGSSGSFNVVDTGLPGPLKIATDNSWYFMNSRGNQFHFSGYDLPGPNYINSEMANYESDFDTYVTPKGYNVVMITAPGLYSAINGIMSGNTWWYYNGTSTDLDRYEVRTWSNWDRLINYARARNVYLYPFGLINQAEVNNALGTTARMNRFQRYYVARTSAYWNLFGNSLTWEWAELWTTTDVNNWMTNPYNWNPFGTLLTVHDSMRSQFAGWGSFSIKQHQGRTIFDGNNRIAGNHSGIQGTFVNNPIIGSEDIWEEYDGLNGQPRNGDEVRRAAWGEMLAGVMPLYSEWEDAGPAGGKGNGAGEAEIIRMFNFFYSKTNYRQYQQLNSLVSSSARQIASGIQGQEYLVYDEDGGSISIDLSGTSSSNTFTVSWFNPTNGTTQTGTNINGGAIRTITSPFSGDSVLFIKSTSISTGSATIDSTPQGASNPITNLSPGTYTLILSLNGYNTMTDNNVIIVAGQNTNKFYTLTPCQKPQCDYTIIVI